MQELINEIRLKFHENLENVSTLLDLEQVRVQYLGRKGPVQALMPQLKTCTPEERPQAGQMINQLKQELAESITQKKGALQVAEDNVRLAEEKLDVTLPGRRRFQGRKHLVSATLEEMVDILAEMGFSTVRSPHIDTDYYNFEALNFEEDHPARDMQDTFYITPDELLRTQCTNMQGRLMKESKPPFRVMAPGRCFRNEEITSRSHVFFHQVDVFYVDENVTFGDLFATMDEFLSKLFKKEVQTRYRPSYFPFVEPGMEVDVECLICSGEGCSVCKHSGWLEVAGAGMVHPEVLIKGGVDPEKYSGFAWGMGIERLVMLRHGVNDIRLFTENDLRFLKQFQ
ncbi:MAG: phenylalanine--tRNA ligase subunit alpha [Waddliaceae bacterium]|nr:phenylalanine--tRNA ligase subunit alpha [Waddliaceae bacterium]